MKINELHGWDVTPKEAVDLQRSLASRVTEREPAGFRPKLVAAADISYERFSSYFHASVVAMTLPEFEIVEIQGAEGEVKFPYVPGLLSFRELPMIGEAFRKMKSRPDAVIIDGHGRAHPRRFGVACHAGIMLGLPTVGCAKSLLVGESAGLGATRGSSANIIHNGEVVGCALRTRDGVKPVYVSVGHMIGLTAACRLILGASRNARLPEPVRAAHIEANEMRKRKRINPDSLSN
ncbi:MAG: endonuclease V [bacterium]